MTPAIGPASPVLDDSDIPSLPLAPACWREVDGLVCGFGDRDFEPPPGTLLLEKQVHGVHVVDPEGYALADGSAWAEGCRTVLREADALLARRPGTVVGVRTADCVPLLLLDRSRRWAAAVHAGWRGTIDGIATAAVESARREGVDPRDLEAALGPSIGPCCYEVSAELGERFEAAGLPVLGPGEGRARPHLDLRGANRELLTRAGLDPSRIVEVGPCTRCASDRFHSYRAAPEAAGRQVSWIGWEDRRPPRGPSPHR